MTLPIRVRLTLWYSALLAAALIGFSVAVYLITANTLESNFDSSLNQRIGHIDSLVREEGGELTLPRGEEQADEPLIPTILFDPSGKLLLGSLPPEARAWLGTKPAAQLREGGFHSVGSIRFLIRPVTRAGKVVGYVLAWQSLSTVDTARHTLLLILFGAGPLLLLVAGIGGLGLARRALRPVAHITEVASTISVTDLHQRVPAGPARDELSELATTFNAMIERLEGAVRREKSFTSDASHELRGPLAVIRAESSLALDRPRSSGEYRQALTVIDEQVSAMEDLLAALLMLARLESSSIPERECVAVARLATEAIDQAQQVVERPDVQIDCVVPPELAVEGSVPLLVRAIRNVIENAMKVSPVEGIVRIRTLEEDAQIVLTIRDQGPGIAAEHQNHIFEPFYQIATARTPGPSHGLGLAICRRIITAHGGEVSVSSEPGKGATFRIRLPKA